MAPDDPVALPPFCSELVRKIDDELDRFVEEQRKASAVEAGLGVVVDELARIVEAGGKRLRPLFCCLGHLAAGGEVDDKLIRAASALELLHTFAIVHDDVMDRSLTRRRQPASWLHLADEHRREGFRGDASVFGISAAILVGDLALVLADHVLLDSGFPAERLLPALDRYDRMRTEVVSGQFLDVLAASRGTADEEEARRIAVRKAGGYTVEGPLQIGALLSAPSEDLLAGLSAYGVPLGEAFQIRDDVLGVFGEPEETGKDRESDLREGKRTVLLAKAMAAASPEDRAFLEARVGKPGLSPDEVDRMRGIIEASGALAGTLALVDELAVRAKQAIDPGLIPKYIGDVLVEMVDFLVTRRA
ncbi:MAG: polyprenyl synthetase family protein [Actinomycetota bacterium]